LRDAGELPEASVEDPDALQPGELVYVIGHPWGNPEAATAGIVGVSGGPGRGRRRGSETRHFRCNVVLAPGNSGGPLLNARVKVVEINAMIFGRTDLCVTSNIASAWTTGSWSRRPLLASGRCRWTCRLSSALETRGVRGS
jgi:serine protease Do